MSNALRRPMTLDEFLAWEERQDRKWEFDGFAPSAMVGVTLEHSAIHGNLTTALRTRLRGTPCSFHGPEVKVRAAGAIRYPDGFVMCSPGRRGQTVVEDPVVVFEILSPGTERVDRRDKLREYRATPSVRRYVMLEQDRVAGEMHVREGDGDRWLAVLLSAGDTLSMPEIGVELPLADLYEDVDVPPLDLRDDEGNPVAPPNRTAPSGSRSG